MCACACEVTFWQRVREGAASHSFVVSKVLTKTPTRIRSLLRVLSSSSFYSFLESVIELSPLMTGQLAILSPRHNSNRRKGAERVEELFQAKADTPPPPIQQQQQQQQITHNTRTHVPPSNGTDESAVRQRLCCSVSVAATTSLAALFCFGESHTATTIAAAHPFSSHTHTRGR